MFGFNSCTGHTKTRLANKQTRHPPQRQVFVVDKVPPCNPKSFVDVHDPRVRSQVFQDPGQHHINLSGSAFVEVAFTPGQWLMGDTQTDCQAGVPATCDFRREFCKSTRKPPFFAPNSCAGQIIKTRHTASNTCPETMDVLLEAAVSRGGRQPSQPLSNQMHVRYTPAVADSVPAKWESELVR